MKLKIYSLLEAFFVPKPNAHLHRNFSDSKTSNGLILIPVPSSPGNARQDIRSRIDR